MRRLVTLILALATFTPLRGQIPAAWTAPLPPFQIADNLFYVGSRDLAAYLITTPAGDILINANLVTSPPQIRSSVEKLGFHWSDIKIFLNSQAHFDHVAGAAEVLRQTHALNEVMQYDADDMRSGGRADFAFGHDITTAYTPTHVDRVLHDGSHIVLGDPNHGGVDLTALRTAGHSRGCTTFTFLVHLPGDPATLLRHVVIVGGWAPLSGYRLITTPGQPQSYPGIAADFEHTFATLHALPCDIFLGAHGSYFNLLPKLAHYPADGPRAFLDPAGYQAAVTEAEHNFNTMLARQRATLASK